MAMTLQESDSSLNMPILPLEIVLRILEFFKDDERTLLSACLVNKTWAEEATSILWRKDPPLPLLASLPNERGRYYAGKIRFLKAPRNESDGLKHDLTHLLFPRLNSVRIHETWQMSYQVRVEQFLTPQLEELYYDGSFDMETIFNVVSSRCPRLQRLHLSSPRGKNPWDSESLLRSLEKCKKLKSVTIECSPDNNVTEEVFFHLAGRERLESLVFCLRGHGKTSKFDIFNDWDIHSGRYFAQLRHLHIGLRSMAFVRLAPMFKSITRLTLDVRDNACGVLQTVATLPDLQHVVVDFKRKGTDLSQENVLALKALSKLQTLSLESSSVYESCASGLSDDVLEELVFSLKDLESIKLDIRHNLSISALWILARHCTRLQHCDVGIAAYELFAPDHAPWPLLPHLQSLKTDHLNVRGLK